jgi:hypothetical protein
MTTPTTCPFCDKKGLPILPLRYAVARADIPHAPKLQAPFGQGVQDITLPEKEAHYTLRFLRSGYLYMFDERRGEWTAYVVTNEGYLFEFDPHASTAPAVHDTHFACTRAGDAHVARCVTVKDARHATKVWLGFSDTTWTPAVLEKHAKQAWREAHMRAFDVAAWRGGGAQPHADTADKVSALVAEFATDPGFVVNAVSRMAAKFSSRVRDAAQSAMQKLSPWNYSPQGFTGIKPQAAGMAEWAIEAAKPFKPAMVAIPDAAGIAMELNHLAIQRALEWTENPDRQWAFSTATTISGIREAVMHGAVQSESQARMTQARINLTSDHGPLTNPFLSKSDRDMLEKSITDSGKISPEEAERIGKDAWSKYEKMFNEPTREAFLKQYASGFNTLEKQTIKPLDTAYLAWLKSEPFKAHFTHNFDPADVESGMAHQAVVYACIKDASGRKGPSDYFKACLGNDPTQPGEVVLRALVFNQDQLARKWNEAAAEKGTERETPWLDMGEKVYGGFKVIFGKEHASELQGALAGLSKYIYEMSAPIMERLNAAAANGTAALAQAALPEQRLLGLMQSIVSAEHPDKVLVDLRGLQTRKQAARALAGFLAELTGENEQRWRSGARAALDEAAAGKTQGYPYQGLFVVDKKQLARLNGMKGAKRAAGVLSATDETEFETLLRGNARYVIGREVTASGLGLILTGFVLTNSFGELMKAQGAARWSQGFNFGAGATAALGEVGQIGGAVLKKTTWGVSDSGLAERLSMGRFGSWAELAEGAGKLLGVVGGVVAGLVQMYEGVKAAMEGDVAFGIGIFVLGFATGAIAIAVFLGSITAGVGLIIVLILVAIGYLVSLFKHDTLQHWLDKSYFGRHELDNEKFNSLSQQSAAYIVMTKGE